MPTWLEGWSFSGTYVCRFCVGQWSQFQEQEVRTGAFPSRTKQQYEVDIATALAGTTHSRGVKRPCAITSRLSHFHVRTAYPPDVLHNLLEGIVPVELALCLDLLIKKKYFSYEESSNSSHTSGKTVQILPKMFHQTLPPIEPLVAMQLKIGVY